MSKEMNQFKGEVDDYEAHNKVNNSLNKTRNKVDETMTIIYSNL